MDPIATRELARIQSVLHVLSANRDALSELPDIQAFYKLEENYRESLTEAQGLGVVPPDPVAVVRLDWVRLVAWSNQIQQALKSVDDLGSELDAFELKPEVEAGGGAACVEINLTNLIWQPSASDLQALRAALDIAPESLAKAIEQGQNELQSGDWFNGRPYAELAEIADAMRWPDELELAESPGPWADGVRPQDRPFVASRLAVEVASPMVEQRRDRIRERGIRVRELLHLHTRHSAALEKVGRLTDAGEVVTARRMMRTLQVLFSDLNYNEVEQRLSEKEEPLKLQREKVAAATTKIGSLRQRIGGVFIVPPLSLVCHGMTALWETEKLVNDTSQLGKGNQGNEIGRLVSGWMLQLKNELEAFKSGPMLQLWWRGGLTTSIWLVSLVLGGLWLRSTVQAAKVAYALDSGSWETALAIDPDNVVALVGRARGKLNVSPPDIEGAFADLDQADRTGRDAATVKAARGDTYALRAVQEARSGNLDTAARDLAEARVGPASDEWLAKARAALAAGWLARAQQLVDKGDPNRIKQALAAAKAAGAVEQNLLAVWEEYAQIQARLLALPPAHNSIGMQFKKLPAGAFAMGMRQVTLTKPFYLGVHEVTNAQWKQVMGSVPSQWTDDNRPVEQVSWEDAMEFCKKLSAVPEERMAGRVYRLPTEAEWEYACSAGSTTNYSFGDDRSRLGEHGWFYDNSGSRTHLVGQKNPNAWGLYDMHGNVLEWCGDWYDDYPKGATTDPQGPARAFVRIYRGGSWRSSYQQCGSAFRAGALPSARFDTVGFRVALSSF